MFNAWGATVFDVQGYYLERPKELVSLGRVLLCVAFAIVLAGLMGKLLFVAPTAVLRIAHPQAVAPSLGQAYPDFCGS